MRRTAPPPGSTAFLYGRFSSDIQNPKSAEDQIAEGEDLCARQVWEIGGRFADRGETGRSVVNRPGLISMLDRATSGEADVIVVEDISRLGRNAADLHTIANRLKEANVVIFTFSSGVMSGLDLSIRASMAEEYSVEHGHRVKRGHRASAKRGRVMGGVAYGYKLADGNGEHDQAESASRARSGGGIAAVDDEFSAGDELRFIRRQVDRAPGHVVRFAHMTEGMQRRRGFPRGLGIGLAGHVMLHHGGLDEAGVDGVHPDAVGRVE